VQLVEEKRQKKPLAKEGSARGKVERKFPSGNILSLISEYHFEGRFSTSVEE